MFLLEIFEHEEFLLLVPISRQDQKIINFFVIFAFFVQKMQFFFAFFGPKMLFLYKVEISLEKPNFLSSGARKIPVQWKSVYPGELLKKFTCNLPFLHFFPVYLCFFVSRFLRLCVVSPLQKEKNGNRKEWKTLPCRAWPGWAAPPTHPFSPWVGGWGG